MPSIRRELSNTPTARWLRSVRSCNRAGGWTERLRDYAALSTVLDKHVAAHSGPQLGPGAVFVAQPLIDLSSLVKLVAGQQQLGGSESVYRRYRAKGEDKPGVRWAADDRSVKPAAALVIEAKISSFWPYREGVAAAADAFDMTPREWAAAYLRSLAAWTSDSWPLAACVPAGPPECVAEDMRVLVASLYRGLQQGQDLTLPDITTRASRLNELAGHVVYKVLEDRGITPLGAFNCVRDDVVRVLGAPPSSPTNGIIRAVAELADTIIHAGDDANADAVPVSQADAERLRSLLGGLDVLLIDYIKAHADESAGSRSSAARPEPRDDADHDHC